MKKIIKSKSIVALVLMLLLVQLPFISEAAETSSSKNIVVYFPNWGMYQAGHNNFTVSMIPWDKVTVINHGFFTVDKSFKLASIDPFADFDKSFEHSEGWEQGALRGHFGEYKYYKSQYPNVKVLVSVGGWTRGENFHDMALTKESRTIFINSCIEFLQKYPFIDGIDIDWEYPSIDRPKDPNDQYDRGCPGGPEDRENFTALLRELRQAYDTNNMADKMLTIAAPAGYDKLEGKQDPNIYHQYLDFINVMTYDFHGAWENRTNHLSPLYANPNDPSPEAPIDIKNKYNMDSAMKLYKDTYNVPSYKLNVGSPFYSRGWKNVDPNTGTDGLFANANGAPVGTWDNPQAPGGQYPYFKLKELENTSGYNKYRDDYARVPYLYNPSLGVMLTYEDEVSLGERCDYVNTNNYGGIVVWEISGDDINGYPMTSLIYEKLIGNVPKQKPGIPVLNVENVENTTDNIDNNGNYTIKMNMNSGNNGTSWKLYENGQLIHTEALTDNSPNPQTASYSVANKPNGKYTYTCELINKYGATSSTPVTVTVNKDGGATGVPGTPVLNHDNNDNDGNYTITMNMASGNNGSSWKLYENGQLIHTEALVDNSPNPQTASYSVTNKPDGTYVYICELINEFGSTSSAEISVTVGLPPKATDKPATPVLSHNNWDNDGDYSITMNMWWGNNGTLWKLYENNELIYSAPLTDNSPNAQSASYDITGKSSGIYTYKCELINAFGNTSSNEIEVTVK
ncbi:glycosyl hydrolase family 18 protein [Paramaledivibacter caminithermalis]|jgi:GH18 family chitinase/plastocyanin|uniref:chitinase n=1 Tax=Paramaledivibacter caminithermalis (strain DSM 15212 / CIP 107654 / DViRD3) TaxID=1121301 RepID=A0A1M6MWS0_PARC5|nr:glycosyl hydrolase family 18 protein [Paramaledivibacter caminithermalis]SHJ87876.1 chitinase family 18 [Paramaledivibacter caminithermalis DSM 15212]